MFTSYPCVIVSLRWTAAIFQLQGYQLGREGLDDKLAKKNKKIKIWNSRSLIESLNYCIILGLITYVIWGGKQKKPALRFLLFAVECNLNLYIHLIDMWWDNIHHILRSLSPEIKILMISKVKVPSSFYILRSMFSCHLSRWI